MQNSSNNKNKKRSTQNNHRNNYNGAAKPSTKNNRPQTNDGHKKAGLNARNEKAKYSDDEIARARYIDSKAKFLVRDRIHNDNIDTRNKWIGVSNLEVKDKWDKNGNYIPEILSFNAEIFDKKLVPNYTDEMTTDEKHQLTYDVSKTDIQKQKSEERMYHREKHRPIYHVDVSSKKKNNNKTEYQVKNIKKIK